MIHFLKPHIERHIINEVTHKHNFPITDNCEYFKNISILTNNITMRKW